MGNTTLKHGNDYGEAPTSTVVLAAGEGISSIFGNADWGINSIGFALNSGTVYGPWGGPGGFGYTISGPVYGFYGGMRGSILGSLGIWTTDPPPLPSPTPAPNPAGMMRSKMFGSALPTDTQWDDGSTFAGNPCCRLASFNQCDRHFDRKH
jgi:hypothetical protein